MYESVALLELALWLGLPAWLANSTPVIFGGGRPIDGGRLFRDGNRILGDGKTIRGFVVGVFFGSFTGLLQGLAAPYIKPVMEEFLVVTPTMEIVLFMSLPVAFLMSVGALVGDIIGSFVKRRVDVKSGGPSIMLDQLGFIIMSLIFAYPVLRPEGIYAMILIVVTLGVHWISNAVGYVLGFKKNPW